LCGLLEEALSRFREYKPGAHLETMFVRAHLGRELWRDIVAATGRGLLETGGVFDYSDDLSPPDKVTDEVNAAVERSPAIAAINSVLTRHGVTPKSVKSEAGTERLGLSSLLVGRRCSDIAAMPGAGIIRPPSIEFDLGGDKLMERSDSSSQPTSRPTGRQ
jgi:hypothetical protein